MSNPVIRITYDGGDATNNSIDAKLFGQSLQGLDRMVSDCIIIFSESRLPKRGERAPLILKAREPKSGSVTIETVYQEVSTALAIGVPIITAIGPEVISHYISAIIDKFSGHPDSMELAINAMVQMHTDALASMAKSQEVAAEMIDRADQRRHEEVLSLHEILKAAINNSGGAASDYVAPIGRSVSEASFVSGAARPVLVKVEEADAIRESQKFDWKTLAPIILTTDGFKFHTNSLSVENPESDGFIMADVTDPDFKEESNRYTQAAANRARIEVLAKKGYKNGALAKIQVVEFVREIDD